MRRFFIILTLLILFFSFKKSHTAREFFDLACIYENDGETELAMTTYRQTLYAARNEGDTALIGLVQQYMGMLLLEQYSFDEAIEMLHQSAATTKDDPLQCALPH